MSSIPSNLNTANDTQTKTTLDPNSGFITIINTYVVAPERAEELLSFLEHSTLEAIRYVPGFISANFHLNLDRTLLVNYAQWESLEAIAAARENPKVAALIQEQGLIAQSFTPVLYKLQKSVAAAHS